MLGARIARRSFNKGWRPPLDLRIDAHAGGAGRQRMLGHRARLGSTRVAADDVTRQPGSTDAGTFEHLAGSGSRLKSASGSAENVPLGGAFGREGAGNVVEGHVLSGFHQCSEHGSPCIVGGSVRA